MSGFMKWLGSAPSSNNNITNNSNDKNNNNNNTGSDIIPSVPSSPSTVDSRATPPPSSAPRSSPPRNNNNNTNNNTVDDDAAVVVSSSSPARSPSNHQFASAQSYVDAMEAQRDAVRLTGEETELLQDLHTLLTNMCAPNNNNNSNKTSSSRRELLHELRSHAILANQHPSLVALTQHVNDDDDDGEAREAPITILRLHAMLARLFCATLCFSSDAHDAAHRGLLTTSLDQLRNAAASGDEKILMRVVVEVVNRILLTTSMQFPPTPSSSSPSSSSSPTRVNDDDVEMLPQHNVCEFLEMNPTFDPPQPTVRRANWMRWEELVQRGATNFCTHFLATNNTNNNMTAAHLVAMLPSTQVWCAASHAYAQFSYFIVVLFYTRHADHLNYLARVQKLVLYFDEQHQQHPRLPIAVVPPVDAPTSVKKSAVRASISPSNNISNENKESSTRSASPVATAPQPPTPPPPPPQDVVAVADDDDDDGLFRHAPPSSSALMQTSTSLLHAHANNTPTLDGGLVMFHAPSRERSLQRLSEEFAESAQRRRSTSMMSASQDKTLPVVHRAPPPAEMSSIIKSRPSTLEG